MTCTHRGLDGGVNGIKEHTVGVLRCVLDRTISKKSAAVGTGAIALRLLVDMVRPCTGCRVGRVAKKYRDVTSRVTPVTYYIVIVKRSRSCFRRQTWQWWSFVHVFSKWKADSACQSKWRKTQKAHCITLFDHVTCSASSHSLSTHRLSAQRPSQCLIVEQRSVCLVRDAQRSWHDINVDYASASSITLLATSCRLVYKGRLLQHASPYTYLHARASDRWLYWLPIVRRI